MRLRTIMSIAAAAALSVGIAPAQAAEEIDFGTPIADFRYNDGEVGVVALAFGPSATARTTNGDRPTTAKCKFVVEPGITSAITLDIVAVSAATPYVNSSNAPIAPAATGVTCTVKLGNGTTRSIAAALPGPSSVARDRFTFTNFVSPVTLCARPNALWTDNVHQISSVEYCETS